MSDPISKQNDDFRPVKTTKYFVDGWATVRFTPDDQINRVCVRGEEVVDFRMSERWHITKVSITDDRREMVLTVERGEEDG